MGRKKLQPTDVTTEIVNNNIKWALENIEWLKHYTIEKAQSHITPNMQLATGARAIQKMEVAVAEMVRDLSDVRPGAWSKEFGALYFQFEELRKANPFVDPDKTEIVTDLLEIVNKMHTIFSR